MRRLIVLLLFPYFVPLITLATVGFVHLLLTPGKPSEGLGPTGSDVMGLYGIGFSLIAGGALQIFVGLPLNALLLRLQKASSRIVVCILCVLIPIALAFPLFNEAPTPLFKLAFIIAIIILTFGSGAWTTYATLKRDDL